MIDKRDITIVKIRNSNFGRQRVIFEAAFVYDANSNFIKNV